MTYPLRPWTSVAMPHADVRDEQAVKAEYAVNLGRVDRGDKALSKRYAEARPFFETTYVTTDLRRLLGNVMAALSGQNIDRVLQLRTPFGGGKSHSLLAMLHLARDRKKVADLPALKGIVDPGPVRVAVLPCADLTPGQPRKVHGGPTIRTLWGELAFRLGGAAGYEAVRRIDETPSAPGGELVDALLQSPNGQASLVLADEVLVYVEKAMAVPAGDSTLGRQTLTFLQALTESVAGDPKAAFVYSLQASIAEAVGAEGLLQTLDKLVGRVDARRVPVQASQVREIVRQRLFESLGDASEHRRVAEVYAEEHRQMLLASAASAADRAHAEEEARQFEEDILAAYPFHPSLIRLMYERWGSLPSYQRTRGALQFLGTVVHVLFKRGHGGALIAPGDIPLDDPDVRSEFFKQVGEREKWDSVLDADIAGDRARAKKVDLRIGDASPALMQARVGTTTATAITMFSFGTRKDDLRGVNRADLLAASLRPRVEVPTLDAALADLKESLLYLHSGGGRFRMDTIPSLTKLIEEAQVAVEPDDVLRKVRTTLEQQFGGASTAVLWPADPGRIPDARREFLFAYLPLEWAEHDRERSEAEARALLVARAGGEKGGKRLFRNGVAFVLPQKAYADQVRQLARRVLALMALDRKANNKHILISTEQKDELSEKLKNAAADLAGACRGLYGQVLLPVRDKEKAKDDEVRDPIAFRTVDIGTLASGLDFHGRLIELLKKQVFNEITADRFVELLQLGAPDGPSFVAMTDALDSFFRFLDYPKMRSDTPLLAAIASAVADGKIGYLPMARLEDDALLPAPGARVRFGKRWSADEFSAEDGAYLVSAALAEALSRDPSRVLPSPPPVPSNVGGSAGASPSDLFETDSSSRGAPTPKAAPKGTKGKRYVLKATAKGRKQWYGLGSAIHQLIGASADVTIRVEVNATQPEGFEPVFLANRVKEVLEEREIEHEAVLASE